jgi:hypothetical protein
MSLMASPSGMIHARRHRSMLSIENIVRSVTLREYTYMDPDLSTRDDIAALLQVFERPPKGRAKPMGAAKAREELAQETNSRTPRARCRCGSCLKCEEDARWERIFVEKFADPMYYAERLPSLGSPLASICR